MLRAIIKLARPAHWLKNGVVLAPLVFAGELAHINMIGIALASVVVFCLVSSGVYTFNDLIDRQRDRLHPVKKSRPLASGAVSPAAAIAIIILLWSAGFAISFLIGLPLLLIAVAYVALNVVYSYLLKNIVIIDVMTIAIGFVLRAYAGAVAIDVPASKWLIINTMLLALFLGFGKRRHELVYIQDAESHRTILSKYSAYLLDQLIGIVTASVVVVYMLYTFSPEVSEKLHTEYLFVTIPFVLYGIFRYLYLIHKEEKGGSPTRVLITDRPILLNVSLWLLTVVIVLYVL
jgi:4-hydroxybenzoate polyprenyltransferase